MRKKDTQLNFIKSDLKAWDASVGKNFGSTLDRYSASISRSGKGLKPIPDIFRGTAFLSSKMYPDAALTIPDGQLKITIDLDYGSKESQIGYALTKASFLVRLGEYNRASVIFL